MDTTSRTTRLAETPLPELVAELAHQTAVINASRARQVELVAAITHTHTVEAEDGTLLHLPMSDTYARLDAAALVAGSLGVSQQAAQGWVDRAEKLTGPLAPVRDAMADGVLDEARARIICEELDEATDEVAAVVAEHLMPEIRAGLVEDPSGESGVRLRRGVHAALAAVDPDAVKERAEKNRSDRCLRRWTSKAGVEEWLATLPAAQSIRAWAAIDALAREFIKDGRSENLDQARADAMIALIEGQPTVSYVVTLGIPLPENLGGDDPATDAPPVSPVDHDPADPPEPGSRTFDHAAPAPGTDVTGPDDTVGDAERGSPHSSGIPEGRAHPAERADAPGEDAVPERPAEHAVAARGERTVAEVVAAALAALERHGNSDIEITGAGNPQPTDVNAAWVAEALTKAAAAGQVRLAAVHPDTGALIDPDHRHATTAYVPGKALSELVKARDGRCRFPGCTLNVRFTDLDHTRPWPQGSTSADNLHSLCRRHHRIKQLVGWQVALRPDGTVQWVDPLGRRYLTRALDHRGRPQAPPTPTPAQPGRTPEQEAADLTAQQKAIEHALARETPASILEEHLGHDLHNLDRELNRHALRTGTPRPWHERHQFDVRYHNLSTRVGQTKRSVPCGKAADQVGPTGRSQYRPIRIEIPPSDTGFDMAHWPGRVQYDEPPF